MAIIALIACSEKKLPHAAQAKNLYTGQRFRLACAWADRHGVETKFVLSAKHGLLGMEDVREPYDETLAGKSLEEVWGWAREVATALSRRIGGEVDRIYILAPDEYAEPLRPFFKNVAVEYPLAGIADEASQRNFLMFS